MIHNVPGLRGIQAKENLTTATMMYRDMDMTYWLEKAETEMRDFT